MQIHSNSYYVISYPSRIMRYAVEHEYWAIFNCSPKQL